MRLFGWFRKAKAAEETTPLPVKAPRAAVGTLEHARFRLGTQTRARDKWQELVDAGQGGRGKTHDECVASLKAVADTPYDGYPNKIAYWEAQVAAAKERETGRSG